MAFNVNGTIIDKNNNGVRINHNSNIGVDTNSLGFVTLTQRPWFISYSNSGWNTYTANAWNAISLSTAFVNNGNHYNTATSRFTAPVTGAYYFEFSSYGSKNPSTNADSYTHPLFLINGSTTARKGSTGTDHRLRGRTYYSSSYSWDQQINDIFYLTAQDYIQPYIYCSGTQQWYGTSTHFTGFYIG
jgi:hypothetical protein